MTASAFSTLRAVVVAHRPLHLWHGGFLSLWMVSFTLASCVNPSVDGAASGFELIPKLIQFGPAGDMLMIQGLGISWRHRNRLATCIWIETYS
jgi:hypothetical protein